MRSTGVRQLKNKLSEYLRLVRQGETVLVTDHDLVIAQITPPPVYAGSPHESELQSLQRLASSGLVDLAQQEMYSATASPIVSHADLPSLSQALAEVRGDRFGEL